MDSQRQTPLVSLTQNVKIQHPQLGQKVSNLVQKYSIHCILAAFWEATQRKRLRLRLLWGWWRCLRLGCWP